ncbi:peptidase S8/S53 domain-containing protein [Lactarius quietus]|nr:peptidase S8/S53 domain-containing protein [Lactarius quietus]
MHSSYNWLSVFSFLSVGLQVLCLLTTPLSPDWDDCIRAYLSREQVAELVAPHPDTLQLINSWLEHYGVPSSSVSTSHSGLYEHAETKDRILRTLGYALPVVLHAYVQAVAPTNYFGSPRKRQQRRESTSPFRVVTPSFLRSLYETSTYVPAATDRNVLAIAGILGDYPSQANLDIQYTQSITFPTPHIFYSTLGEVESYLIWLDYVLRLERQDFAEGYATSLCHLFAQLGARGASVLFASGDSGVAGMGDDCAVQFQPMFPASCKCGVAAFSSGGFSNYFKREPYQDEAVAGYLRNLGNRYVGLYNASSRGIPDIAAQSYEFHVYGTSCSTPVAAAVISLLNDYRISQGRPALGFLNPWLYGKGHAGFNDIKLGFNPGCDTKGFPAIAGWDPVTGFGTPNLTKLMEIPLPDARGQ